MTGDASARRFVILAVVMVVAAFTGGSSRATAPTLIFLRPALAFALVMLAVLPGPRDWRGLRFPAILLGLFAASMVLQLLPVPANWWLSLPGHARYTVAVRASGVSTLPLSLSPDLTLNSLMALMPAACVLLAYAGMRTDHRRATVWLAVAMAIISLAFALAQLGGKGGVGYIYGGQQDYVAGILANRNHQALLLCATLPLLAVLARQTVSMRQPRSQAGGHGASQPPGRAIVVLIAVLGAIMVPMILLTGSRQGLALAVAAILAAILLAPKPAARSTGRPAARSPAGGLFPRVIAQVSGRWLIVALVLAVAALLVLAIVSGRAVSVERLMAPGIVTDDARLRNLPTVLAITRLFQPFGIGYGTFEPVYRGFEPDALLHASYFNHAHNDLIETVMTGGLAAVGLILGLFVLIVRRGAAMLRGEAARSRQAGFLDRAGLVVVLLVLAASLVDYPLRTSVVTLVFTLALCWMSAVPALSAGRTRRRRPDSGTLGKADGRETDGREASETGWRPGMMPGATLPEPRG